MELLTAADVTVACQAISGRELLDYLEQGDRPDAVLLHIQMEGPRDDGVATAEEIFERWPAQNVLLLSNLENDDLIRRFFAGGTARRDYISSEKISMASKTSATPWTWSGGARRSAIPPSLTVSSGGS